MHQARIWYPPAAVRVAPILFDAPSFFVPCLTHGVLCSLNASPCECDRVGSNERRRDSRHVTCPIRDPKEPAARRCSEGRDHGRFDPGDIVTENA